MFDNIGGKIKTLAKVLCWIGIIASVIFGIIYIAWGIDSNVDELVITGVIYTLLGPLLSWVSSFALYGFGELIENTQTLLQNQATIAYRSHDQMLQLQEVLKQTIRENPDAGNSTITNQKTNTEQSANSCVIKTNPNIPIQKGMFEIECPTCGCVQPNNNNHCTNCGRYFDK